MGCTSSVPIPRSPLHGCTSTPQPKPKSTSVVACLMECWAHPHSDAFDWAATSVAILQFALDVWNTRRPILSLAQQTQLADALAVIHAEKPSRGLSSELDSLDRTPQVCLKQALADPARQLKELDRCLHRASPTSLEWAEVVVSLVDFVSVLLGSVALTPSQCQQLRAAASEFEADNVQFQDGMDACDSFRADRFRPLSAEPPTVSSKEWLQQLPTADHKRRFPPEPIRRALGQLEAHVKDRVADVALMADLFGRDPAAEEHVWAIAVYTAELYDDPQGEKRSPHQVYRELNAACRMYSHRSAMDSEQRREWELFLPHAKRLQAALSALPPLSVSLCRSMGSLPSSSPELPAGALLGSFLGATPSTVYAAAISAKDGALGSHSSRHLLILSDTARSIERLSLFPAEEEHLHLLGTELEECTVFPPSLLQQFGTPFSVTTLKRRGAPLTLDLLKQALRRLWALRGAAGCPYVPHRVKHHPSDREDCPLEAAVTAFLAGPAPRRPLVLTGPSGVGKTECALWLASPVVAAGRLWLFVSLPAVQAPFGPNALVDHLLSAYGLQGNTAAQEQLRREPLVLVLDGLDEVERPSSPPMQTWWELNHFDRWDVRLVVTCRDDRVGAFGRCLGDHPATLSLQRFDEAAQVECLRQRLRAARAEEPIADAREKQAEPLPNPALSRSALQQDAKWLLHQVSKTLLRKEFDVPLYLTMTADLVCDGQRDPLASRALLYGRWLDRALARPAPGQRPSTARTRQRELAEMEKLAWDLHRRRLSVDMVGPRGTQAWFQKLPLRAPSFHPDAPFSFQHKSLQDYLAAAHLFRRLQADELEEELDVDLTQDHALLSFFGELLRNHRNGVPLCHWLLATVLASQQDPKVARRSANCMSLLAAAHFSFKGLDLRGIRAPNAMLRGALLPNANLQGAHLQGADFRGAILEEADLQNADLHGCNFGELLESLEGHVGAVHGMAMSANGDVIASASYDGCVRLWNGLTGQLIHVLHGHSGAVYGVALSADGTVVASGSRDGTVCLWDSASGQRRHTLGGHAGAVNGVAVSSDGGLVLSASDDGTVRIWKCDTGEVLQTLEGHGGPVYCVSISSDSRVLASASDDGVVHLWRVATGELVRSLRGHTDIVHSVALSADGRILASASRDQTVRVWDSATGQLLHTLEAHDGIVYAVAVSADGNTIASASRDQTMCVWNRVKGERWVSAGHGGAVTAVCMSSDGAVVASGSANGTVRVLSHGAGASMDPTALQSAAAGPQRVLAQHLTLSRSSPAVRLLQRFGAVPV